MPFLPEAARDARQLQADVVRAVTKTPGVSRAERELRTFIFSSEPRARRRVPLGVQSRREQGGARPRVAARRRRRRRALEAEVARRAGLVRSSCPRHITDVARRAEPRHGQAPFGTLEPNRAPQALALAI